jgi:hypothetical protein
LTPKDIRACETHLLMPMNKWENKREATLLDSKYGLTIIV